MISTSRPRILIIGGAGYIGSHCSKYLAARHFIPIVYDNLSIGRREFVKWGPFVEGDVRDEELLIQVLSMTKPAAVMHFAALALVGESVIDPDRYWQVNVAGTLSLLRAMKSVGINNLIFSSTCAIYGTVADGLITEDTPMAPINPYGSTKLAAEWMMDQFSDAYELRSVRLRYFNASGADPEAQLGEDRDVETHLIPNTLDVAIGKRAALTIYGSDYATPDGTAIRDYIHVQDLANAHLLALKYLLDHGKSVALNLGTGTGSSVAEIVKTAERLTGQQIPCEIAARRPGDPPRLIAASDRARSVLGWQPERSSIDTILTDAWIWHKKRYGKHL